MQVTTPQLRPHDRVVQAPAGRVARGDEALLVIGGDAVPFPATEAHGVLRLVTASGVGETYGADAVWEVERRDLDDCRACFLYRARRSVTHL